MEYSRRLTDHVATKSEIKTKVIKSWVKELLSLSFICSGLVSIQKIEPMNDTDLFVTCLFAAALFVIARFFTQYERSQLKYLSNEDQECVLNKVGDVSSAKKFCKKVSGVNRNLTVEEAHILYSLSEKIVR